MHLVPDQVCVRPLERTKPGMKVSGHFPSEPDRNISRQLAIQRPGDSVGRDSATQIEMNDLSSGMNPAIRPTRDYDPNWITGNLLDRLLQSPLDRSLAFALPLEPSELGSVVLEDKLYPARIRATVRHNILRDGIHS